MSFPWAISIAREDASALAPLRLSAGIEVAEGMREIWLRGKSADEGLLHKLSGLPARERFEWLATNQLRRVDQRVPSARLPELRWQPIAGWVQVELPASAFPAFEPRSISLRLARSQVEREPELLLAATVDFREFAVRAAAVRLQRLQFAANGRGEVLIRGTPLPPLPGKRFVMRGSVAVPAGFSWKPAVSADVVIRLVGASGEALVVWNEDGTITRLHSEQFVAATRSAVNATP